MSPDWRRASFVSQVSPALADRLWGVGGDLHDIGRRLSERDPARMWEIADAIAVGAHDDTLKGGLSYRERLMLRRILVAEGVVTPRQLRRLDVRVLTSRMARWLSANPAALDQAKRMTMRLWRLQKRAQARARARDSRSRGGGDLFKEAPPAPGRLVQDCLDLGPVDVRKHRVPAVGRRNRK